MSLSDNDNTTNTTVHTADIADAGSVPLTDPASEREKENSARDARLEAAERMLAKRQLRNWKTFAIFVLSAFLAYLAFNSWTDVSGNPAGGDYVARVHVDGFITESRERNRFLSDLNENENIKGVIVHINSPGGTLTGGEDWYRELRSIAEEKPVAAVVGGMAASGGYMAALAADKIFVREGSVVGSVGVIYQTANIVRLAEKMGVDILSYASGDLKAQPSPVMTVPDGAEAMIMEMIEDVKNMFLGLTKERRDLDGDTVKLIADGRIVSGKRATEIGLADAIGDEEAALAWFTEEHDLPEDIDIRTKEPAKKKGFFGLRSLNGVSALFGGAAVRAAAPSGLLAVHPY